MRGGDTGDNHACFTNLSIWSDGTVGSDYFDQPEMVEALQTLSALAAGESS